jgi:hypothetical protein
VGPIRPETPQENATSETSTPLSSGVSPSTTCCLPTISKSLAACDAPWSSHPAPCHQLYSESGPRQPISIHLLALPRGKGLRWEIPCRTIKLMRPHPRISAHQGRTYHRRPDHPSIFDAVTKSFRTDRASGVVDKFPKDVRPTICVSSKDATRTSSRSHQFGPYTRNARRAACLLQHGACTAAPGAASP